jgi:DNA-binding response OmpR family regulator
MATISDQQHAHSSSTQHTLLIATGDEAQRSFLAAQLDADGHTVYAANDAQGTVARLSGHAIDVLILGDLDRSADGLRLLRAIRAHQAGYLLLRAVLATVTRRTLQTITSRHLQIGQIHIDLAARTVDVADQAVSLSRLEFELLVKFAGDPTRVFSKHELARCIWRQQQIKARTVDSHVTRLRHQLVDAGAGTVLVNKWGHGWALTTPH